MTLKTLNEKGQSNVEIGRTLGVTKGAVRYHLRRAVAGRPTGGGTSRLIHENNNTHAGHAVA